jgi:hypothetical protein
MTDLTLATVRLPLTVEQFDSLPRDPFYRYAYLDGQACLIPEPVYCSAHPVLRPSVLAGADGTGAPALRRLRRSDWDALPYLFADAFAGRPPFGALGRNGLLRAAEERMQRTRSGGNGPLVAAASFVATEPGSERPLGAILITLPPAGESVADDAGSLWDPGPVRPHVTWVFVQSVYAGRGWGTALLRAAVRELVALGHRRLDSTFMLGNYVSMMWHWRNGFRLEQLCG